MLLKSHFLPKKSLFWHVLVKQIFKIKALIKTNKQTNKKKKKTPPRHLSYDNFHAILAFYTHNCVPCKKYIYIQRVFFFFFFF